MPVAPPPKVKRTKKAQPAIKEATNGEAKAYDKIDTQLFLTENKPSTYANIVPMDWDLAKDLLGWQEETKDQCFSVDFPALFHLDNGIGVRCGNNRSNRPFYISLATDYKYEILRKKWKFNGETMVFDWFGNLHEGQHRLVGLCLACMEWEKDRDLPVEEQRWQKNWPDGPPQIDALVVMGINPDDADTIGVGKRRNTVDVLYRAPWFADLNKPEEKKRMAKILSWAVRLLWNRTGQQLAIREKYGEGFGTRRPHSEILDFVKEHPRLVDCVKFIVKLNDASIKKVKADDVEHVSPKGLLQYLALGHAAALMYLMACSDTDNTGENPDRYELTGLESSLDFGKWKMACNFWTKLCDNDAQLEGLTNQLIENAQRFDITPGYRINLTCGLIIKSWNLLVSKKPITDEAVKMAEVENEFGRLELDETPLLDGIDCGPTNF